MLGPGGSEALLGLAPFVQLLGAGSGSGGCTLGFGWTTLRTSSWAAQSEAWLWDCSWPTCSCMPLAGLPLNERSARLGMGLLGDMATNVHICPPPLGAGSAS